MIGYQFLFYDSLLKRNPYIFFPDRVIGYCICLGKQSRTCRCFCERVQTSPVHAGVSASVYKRVPYMPVFLRACTNESRTCRCFYERVQTSPVHAGVSTSVYKRVLYMPVFLRACTNESRSCRCFYERVQTSPK